MEGVCVMAKGGSFDFREVRKLQKQIEAIEEGKDAFCRECARELAARLLQKIVKRTPTGEKPDYLTKAPKIVKVKGSGGKSSTFLSREGAILQKYWSGYVGGTLKRSWTVGDIQKTGDGYRVEIFNPTEYASYVEYGHRQEPGRYVPALGRTLKKGWTPGKLMMTISEKEIEKAAPKLLEKKLEEYLRRCLDGE